MNSYIDPISSAVQATVVALRERHGAHWIIAFSGGKDSSAALKIFLAACRVSEIKPSKVTVIYCDTGVENPVLDAYVKGLLSQMEGEFDSGGMPLEVKILKAPVLDRFFVRMIGRGYPPPTNSFRWCTTGLRIRPVSRFIMARDPVETVVVLGLRRSESQQRDRSLALSASSRWQKQREGNGDYDIFLPIIDLGVEEVWDAVFSLGLPKSLNPHVLDRLYRNASGECPVIRAPKSPPCGSGRFGCWTCTVVRKDKSAHQLIQSGYRELEPYFKFRNWLVEIRNDPDRRWKKRRNGSDGMGPFTIEARKEILAKIDALEELTACVVVNAEERRAIFKLWELDDLPRINYASLKR